MTLRRWWSVDFYQDISPFSLSILCFGFKTCSCYLAKWSVVTCIHSAILSVNVKHFLKNEDFPQKLCFEIFMNDLKIGYCQQLKKKPIIFCFKTSWLFEEGTHIPRVVSKHMNCFWTSKNREFEYLNRSYVRVNRLFVSLWSLYKVISKGIPMKDIYLDSLQSFIHLKITLITETIKFGK